MEFILRGVSSSEVSPRNLENFPTLKLFVIVFFTRTHKLTLNFSFSVQTKLKKTASSHHNFATCEFSNKLSVNDKSFNFLNIFMKGQDS